MIVSTSVLVVEWDPCFHCVCPQEASQLPPTSLGDSQDQQVGTPQASFKLLPLWWFQSMWDFMCALQNQSLFLMTGSPIHKAPLLPSKPDILGACLPIVGIPKGAQCGAPTPYSMGVTSAVVIILSFVSCLSWKCESVLNFYPSYSFCNFSFLS